jgi:hypothetical protein
MRRLHDSKRSGSETALAFLIRVKPLVQAVELLRMLPKGAVIKTVWSKDALGDDYFKLNSIGFMRIDDKLKDGTIRDMGQLQAHVQELSGYEQVPEVAAPVVPKERHADRNKKKALCLQNKHMGHTTARHRSRR